MKDRFRGYLPVILDLETGGFDSRCNPILELACAFVSMESGKLQICEEFSWAVSPFSGAIIEESSLKITGINLDDPDRIQMEEKAAINGLFKLIRKKIKSEECTRAIMVAHNASFDQGFLHAACDRTGIKRNPFHPFSTIDTVSLAAIAFGHTVLSESCYRAGLEFDGSKAHQAAYDANRTAALFCKIANESNFEFSPLRGVADKG